MAETRHPYWTTGFRFLEFEVLMNFLLLLEDNAWNLWHHRPEKISNYNPQGFGIRKNDSEFVETRHTKISRKLSFMIFRYSVFLVRILEIEGQN